MQKIKKFFKNKYFQYILWLGFIFLAFLSLDIITRYATTRIDAYFSTLSIYPLLFSIAWISIFLIVLIILPKKIGKICYITILSLYNILSFAELIHLNLLGRNFSIYDIFSIGEGLTYFNGIITHISLYSLLIIFLSLLFSYGAFKFWPDRRPSNRVTFTLLLSLVLIFLACHSNAKYYMGSILEEDTWNSNSEPAKVYNLYSNPTSALQVSGLYEFSFRSIYLFLNEEDNITKEELQAITTYLDSRNLKKENSYTGLLQDKNVIMIMLESVDNIFFNSDIMPNLTKLKEESIYFTNRYSPIYGIGATFNAEFTSLTGTYSSNTGKAAYFYTNNNYQYSLPNLFKNSGYTVNSFHMNKGTFYDRSSMHQAIGFSKYNSFYNYVNDYIYIDSEILNYDAIYEDIAPKDTKFFSYIVTYSAHMPYKDSNPTCNKYMQEKFYDTEDYETSCFKSALYDTDKFIGNLVEKLKQDNLLADTVIILYGDHLSYAYSKRVEMGGVENYDLNKGVYMIYNPTIAPEKVSTINTTIDMTPTIANLFNLNGYNPNNYLGSDVFNKDTYHLAYFSDYNWYDGRVYSGDLSFKDYNKNKKYYDEINEYVTKQIDYNNLIVMGNYYKYR